VFPFALLPELEGLLRAQRGVTTQIERAKGCIVPAVFHRTGGPTHSLKSFRRAWAKACDRAQLVGRIPHDSGGRPSVTWSGQGCRAAWPCKLTGHKTEAIYRRDAIVAEADLAVGVTKLAAFHQTERRRVITLSAVVAAGGVTPGLTPLLGLLAGDTLDPLDFPTGSA
jgi:hypothetical protein